MDILLRVSEMCTNLQMPLVIGSWILHNLEKYSLIRRDQKDHTKLIVHRFVN